MALGHALDAVDKAGGNVLDGTEVNAAIRNIDFVGATGRVVLNDNGDRVSDISFSKHTGADDSWESLDLVYASTQGIEGTIYSTTGATVSDLFHGGSIPSDAYPPSTPVIKTSLDSLSEPTLKVEWGDFETFRATIQTLQLLVSKDTEDVEHVHVNATSSSREMKMLGMKDKVCVRLVVLTRGGQATSEESCEQLPKVATDTFFQKNKEAIIGSIVAILLLGLAVVVFLEKKNMAQNLKIQELQQNVTMLQEYKDKEKEMIQAEIDKFKEEYGKAKKEKPLDAFLIPADEIKPEQQLGKGAFGIVYRGTYHGQDVAIKTMSEVEQENMERFRSEILLMRDLRHENIVVMVGAVWSEKLMALVLEFCEHGAVGDWLKSENKKGSVISWEDPLLKWVLDIAKGLRYIHSVSYFDVKSSKKVENIVHRDVKPDNVLVNSSFRAKVADFGEARVAVDATMTMVGTPIYVAPEVMRGEHYDTKADVYSFAITVLAMALKGKINVQAFLMECLQKDDNMRGTMSIGRVAFKMSQKQWRPMRAGKRLNLPSKMFSLLGVCWVDDQDARPSFDEIVEYLETEVQKQVYGVKEGMASTRRMSAQNSVMMKRIVEMESKLLEEKGKATVDVATLVAEKKELLGIVENQKMMIEKLKGGGADGGEVRRGEKVVSLPGSTGD